MGGVLIVSADAGGTAKANTCSSTAARGGNFMPRASGASYSSCLGTDTDPLARQFALAGRVLTALGLLHDCMT